MKIWTLLKWVCHRLTNRKRGITAIQAEELPDSLEENKLYIIGENGFLWYSAMMCPCGCGEILHMGLMPNQKPKWSVIFHKRHVVSLHPSVWRKVGCQSHFWIRRGRIIWVNEQS